MNLLGAERAMLNATPLPKTPPEIGGSPARPTESASVGGHDDDSFVVVKLGKGPSGQRAESAETAEGMEYGMMKSQRRNAK